MKYFILFFATLLSLNVQASPKSQFGLNSGIGKVSVRHLRQYSQKEILEKMAKQAQMANAIHVKWYRKHCADMPTSFAFNHLKKHGYDFKYQDAFVKEVQKHDMQLIISLAPYWQCDNPLFRLIPAGSQYFPQDVKAYREYVRRVVERYDGDGVDDMPGLKYDIKYWQLDNEVDGKSYAKIGQARQQKQNSQNGQFQPLQNKVEWITPQTYVRLLKITREEILKADASAKLLPSFLVVTRYQIPKHTEYFKKFVELGGEDYVDAIDFHEYNYDLELFQKSIRLVKSLLKKNTPLWILETSVQSDSDANSNYNLTEHARAIVKFHVTAFAMGVQKVFWHTLADGPKFTNGPMFNQWKSFGSNSFYACIAEESSQHSSFSFFSQAYAQYGGPPHRKRRFPPPFHKRKRNKGQFRPLKQSQKIQNCKSYRLKPGGETYKIMVKKLDGFDSVQKLTDTAYQFIFDNKKPVIVAWSDEKQVYDFSQYFKKSGVRVTSIKESYLHNMTIEKAVAERVKLTPSPIFIEEM